MSTARRRVMVILLIALLALAATMRGAEATQVGSSSIGNARGATELDVVALGDSYSAGVGAGTSVGVCGRTDAGWAEKAYRSSSYIGGSRYQQGGFLLAACGGATTTEMTDTQLASITSGHNVATLTIGGNDIGFSNRVATCVLSTCSAKALAIEPDTGTWFDLRVRLSALYKQIRQRMSPEGHLYVMTYPILFGVEPQTCFGFTTAEQAAANATVTKLDDVIANAVRDANRTIGASRAGNVHLVEWRPPASARIRNGYVVPAGLPGAGTTFDTFIDHDLGACNTKENAANVSGWTWHPTAQGYFRAAGRFFNAFRFHQPLPVS